MMRVAMRVMGLCALLAWGGSAWATQSENTGIRVLPAPGAVTIDGKAADWDLSGGLLIVDDAETQRDRHGVWLFAMHDARHLYLLAHFLDETPLNNPGQTIADYGFAGDSLQMRFILAPDTPTERVSHWTMWRGSDARDKMDVAYGKQFNEGGLKDAKEKGAQQAFMQDADGKGYLQEMAIPWTLLTKNDTAPVVGTTFAMTAEPNFTVGVNGRMSIKDLFKPGIIPDRVFTFMSSPSWGPASVLATGKVPPGPERLADGRLFPMQLQNGWPVIDWTGLIRTAEMPGFMPVTFTMPADGYISLNITAPDGTVARQLLNQAFYTKGKHTVQWDGLTTPNWRTPGQPVTPGTYTWRAITHTGIELKLRGWACNGGKTPWDNGPSTNWGGDHGVPIAVAADETQVYLGWSYAEAGKALVATDRHGVPRWSNSREGMAGLSALAVDGATIYILSGDNGSLVYKLTAADGKYQDWGTSTDADLQIKSVWADPVGQPQRASHIAARAGLLYLSFPDANQVAVLDGKTGKLQKTYAMAAPSAVATLGARLLAVSGGKSVLACDLHTGAVTTLIDTLQAAQALAIGPDGRIYVGLGAPTHQVKVFTADGKSVGTIGRHGGRALLGKWTPDGLYSIKGLAVDADGKLWAAEGDDAPKRISAWDTKTRTFVAEFFGPTGYGALGGAICPTNPQVMVGQGCEWKINPDTGRAACTAVITRAGMSNARFAMGNKGRVYLGTVPHWAFNEGPLTIFERIGEAEYRPRTVIFYADADGKEVSYTGKEETKKTMIWSDANGDGQRQPEEITGCEGVKRFSGWYMRFGPDMSLYFANQQFRPTGFTACGAPLYDLAHPTLMPNYGHGLGSADGRFVLINGDYGVSNGWTHCYEIASGKQIWTYPDNFVGVHGSHNAVPPQVGMIRGSFDPCASVTLPAPIGNAWIITTNVGEWHILTQDGFYLTKLFQGDPLKVHWPAEAVPGAEMSNTPPGMGGEDFGGSATLANDGKLYLQAGKTAFLNLEVTGLDSVTALPGDTITFTDKHVLQAQAMREQQLQVVQGTRTLSVRQRTPAFTGRLDADFPEAEIVAFQKQETAAVRAVAAWDAQHLYLGWDVKDNTPWVNSATDITAMYLSGDTVDFQLGADSTADRQRDEAVLGDFRLSLGNFQGNAAAVIYRKVSAVKQAKQFSSGVVKSYQMDYVQQITDAKITVTKRGDGYTVEAAIPLAALGITPADGLMLRGDFGVTHGDPAGRRTRLRSYWSNLHTGIVDDAVFELQMEPKNWGEMTFRH